MITVLAFGIVWTVWGLIGILGFQVIPEKYKGKEWTKSYIRSQGVSWILLGIPWLIIYAVTHDMGLETSTICIILVIAALPTLVYGIINDRKYKKLLKEQ